MRIKAIMSATNPLRLSESPRMAANRAHPADEAGPTPPLFGIFIFPFRLEMPASPDPGRDLPVPHLGSMNGDAISSTDRPGAAPGSDGQRQPFRRDRGPGNVAAESLWHRSRDRRARKQRLSKSHSNQASEAEIR